MTAFNIEASPGRWDPPPGVRPAWDWTPPEHGLSARLDRVPLWVRVWYSMPLLDRYAYSWMWHHGGWDIVPPLRPGPDEAGVREPAPPKPSRPTIPLSRTPDGE